MQPVLLPWFILLQTSKTLPPTLLPRISQAAKGISQCGCSVLIHKQGERGTVGTKKCISAGWGVGGVCSGKKGETGLLRIPWHAQREKIFRKQVVKDPENCISRSVEKTVRAAGNLLTAGNKTSADGCHNPAGILALPSGCTVASQHSCPPFSLCTGSPTQHRESPRQKNILQKLGFHNKPSAERYLLLLLSRLTHLRDVACS